MSGIGRRGGAGGDIIAKSIKEDIIDRGDGYTATFAQGISQDVGLVIGMEVFPISPAPQRNVLFDFFVYSEVMSEIRMNENVTFTGTTLPINLFNQNRNSTNEATQVIVNRRDDGVVGYGTYLIPSTPAGDARGLFVPAQMAGTQVVKNMILKHNVNYFFFVYNRHTAAGTSRVGFKMDFYEFD